MAVATQCNKVVSSRDLRRFFKKRGIAFAMVALGLVIGVHTLVTGDHLCLCLGVTVIR